jgi:hypothetical protein
MKQVTINGSAFDFDVVVNLMDDEIREALHNDMAPCDNQSFVDAYLIAHKDKHGQAFVIN